MSAAELRGAHLATCRKAFMAAARSRRQDWGLWLSDSHLVQFLEPRETSGIFRRATGGTVDQPYRLTGCVRGPASDQLEPVKPAVAEVVLIERGPGSRLEK